MAQETILLVEDEPAVRQLFATALSRAGYTVFEARNGEEAVKVFDQHADDIDLLLTDMRMPYMGGAELAAAAPRAKPGPQDDLHLRLRRLGRHRRVDRLSRQAVFARRDAEESSRSAGPKLS